MYNDLVALPSNLWIPDGPLDGPPSGAAGRPVDGGSGLGASLSGAAAPVTRRRAVLRGEGAVPDRPVLLELLRGPGLPGWLAEAQARREACHANLLRPLRAGLLDGQTGYVISEQPEGVDLLTVLRAARAQPQLRPPPWFLASVLQEAARGLLALQRAPRERGRQGRVGLHPARVFLDWQGDVRLLAFSALSPDSDGAGPTGLGAVLAPELRAGPRLAGPAADVYALGQLLCELLPDGGAALARLRALGERGRAPRSEDRPGLREIVDGLEAYLLAEAPLQRRAARGAQLAQLCPPESAGELGAVDLLGAWEDVWGAPAPSASASTSGVRDLRAALASVRGPMRGAARGLRGGPGERGAAGAEAGPPARARLGAYLLAAALLLAAIYFALQAL